MWILTKKINSCCIGFSFSDNKPGNNEPNLKWEEYTGDIPIDFDTAANKYQHIDISTLIIRPEYAGEKGQEELMDRKRQECDGFINKYINPVVWHKFSTPEKNEIVSWWDDWQAATQESEIPERPTVLDQFDPAPPPMGKKKAKK